MKKIIVLLVFLFQSSFAYATPGYVFQTDYSTIYTDIKKVKFLANQDISQIGDFPIKYYNGRISQIGNNYVTYLNHCTTTCSLININSKFDKLPRSETNQCD